MEKVEKLQEKILEHEEILNQIKYRDGTGTPNYYERRGKLFRMRRKVDRIISDPVLQETLARESFPTLFEEGPQDSRQRLQWLTLKVDFLFDVCFKFIFMIDRGNNPLHQACASGVANQLGKLREERDALKFSLWKEDYHKQNL